MGLFPTGGALKGRDDWMDNVDFDRVDELLNKKEKYLTIEELQEIKSNIANFLHASRNFTSAVYGFANSENFDMSDIRELCSNQKQKQALIDYAKKLDGDYFKLRDIIDEAK